MSSRIAILASGEGTTAEAFIRACTGRNLEATVVLIICNRENAGIFSRIENLNQELGLSVKTVLVNGKTQPATADEVVPFGGQTQAEERKILQLLAENKIDLVLLMGYLRRVGPRLVHEFGWRAEYESAYQARMLNTHPGLLPETKGLWGIHVQEHVIEQGLSSGGQTLHVVAEDYDDGPVVTEHEIAVEPGDDAVSFFERVKAVEKQSLPIDVRAFIIAREQYFQPN